MRKVISASVVSNYLPNKRIEQQYIDWNLSG